MFSKKTRTLFLIIFILTGVGLISYKLSHELAWAEALLNKNFSRQNFSTFLRTWQIIKQNYVDPQKVDPDKAMFEAIRGLVRSLGDSHSDFLSATQAKIFEEDLSGSFGGVGFEIGIRNGVLTVIAPLEGTPAERAGLKAGDKILKINDESTENMSLEEAVSKIRGKPGTNVKLTIFREKEWLEAKDFVITREIIKIEVVKSKLLDSKIGYIKVNSFSSNIYYEFLNAYKDLKNKGANRFIIDLRNNPGGFLEMAIKMSELFLPRGKVILKEVSRSNKIKDIVSEGPGNLEKEKVVILINKGSASASEIFAGALRDNNNVKIIGEKSFGKGSVQQVFNVDKNMLKLTIAYWLTPKGTKIEGNGITPDIEIKEPSSEEKEKNPELDPILDKAKEIVKNL